MKLEDLERYRAEKEHLMRNEGKHPANYSQADVEKVEKLPPHIRNWQDTKDYRKALSPFMHEDDRLFKKSSAEGVDPNSHGVELQ